MLRESEQSGKREINKIKSLMFFSYSPSYPHIIYKVKTKKAGNT